MVSVVQAQVLTCVEFNKGPSLPLLFATLVILSVTSVVVFVFCVLGASVHTMQILHFNYFSVCIFDSRTMSLPSCMSLLNVLLFSFTLEVGLSIVRPCPHVPNSTLQFHVLTGGIWS